MEFKIVWNNFRILSRFVSYPVALNLSCILEVRVDQPKQSLLTGPCRVFWGLLNAMYFEGYQICILRVTIVGYRATSLSCGLPWWSLASMSDELILQISCNIFLAFKWILMMTSGQNISHYTTAKLSVRVWNHELIWWQNKINTQKHFHKTQMPTNPNQKSRTRDNKAWSSAYCGERVLCKLPYSLAVRK